jgi:hypothetical protein
VRFITSVTPAQSSETLEERRCFLKDFLAAS